MDKDILAQRGEQLNEHPSSFFGHAQALQRSMSIVNTNLSIPYVYAPARSVKEGPS